MDLTLKKVFEFLRKVDEINISSEARDLLIHYMTHQGKDYVFHNNFIADQKGWSRQYMERYKKELVTENLIFSDFARENGKRVGTRVIVNYDFPNVIISNVSNPNVSKSNVRKPNVRKANVRKPDVIESKKINRELEDRKKELETHTSSSVASAPAGAAASVCVPPQPASITPKTETVPPEVQTSPVRPRNRKQTVPVSENPPSLEDIKAYIPEVLRGKGITGWTEQDIHSTAYDIWNRYTNNRWTTAKGDPMYSWENAVTGWILRNNGIPQRMAPVNQQQGQPQNGKSFKQQERDYANRYLIDPIGTAISDCVNQSIIAGGDPCDWGLAPQFHDEAMKLMETRKEQALSGHTPAAPIDIFGIGFGGKE